MSSAKSIFSQAADNLPLDAENEERQLALEYIAEAWNTAEDDGLESLSLAHASLFAALATFVSAHGDEAAAKMVNELPDRIRAGDYTLDKTIQ